MRLHGHLPETVPTLHRFIYFTTLIHKYLQNLTFQQFMVYQDFYRFYLFSTALERVMQERLDRELLRSVC